MRLRNPLSFVLSALMVLTLFAGILMWQPEPASATGETAVVTSDSLNIRSGPGTNHSVIAKAVLNERLPVVEKSGDWYKVRIKTGATGWVAGWLVSIERSPAAQAPPAGQVAVVKSGTVNVRSGPGTGHGLVATVGQAERLPVLGKSGDWYKIQLKNGSSGWVAGWLVNIESAPRPPAQSNPPAQVNPSVPSSGQTAVVNSDVLNVRSGPGTSFGLVTKVGHAERFPVLDKSGDWYKIQLRNGSSGWVAGWLVNIETAPRPPAQSFPPAQANPAAPSGGQVAVVNSDVLNVRSGPGTSFGLVTKVGQAERFPVLDKSGDWCKIQLKNGSSGWVAGWLVTIQSVTPPRPPAQDPSRGDPGTSFPPGKVLGLTISGTGDETRAVIHVDEPFIYDSFILSGPDRLVLDLKGVSLGELPAITEVKSKTVSQIRAGYFQREPDITRVVFDLKGSAMYVAFMSSDRKSLTIDTYIPNIEGSLRGKIIAIDPGHGGPEPGAIGPGGTKEKDITLDVSLRVARLLEAQGAKVVMTRKDDIDLGLYERTDLANWARADIFVSIHMNANTNPAIGGTSTFIFSGNGDTSQAGRIQDSHRLARYVQNELVSALGLRDIGVLEAAFAVLRTANMPAILAEVAFISNDAEERLMRTDDFKNKSAEAIVRGIGLYFGERKAI